MNIQITARGIVSVRWDNDLTVDEVPLSKQIADAIRSSGVPEKTFADVTVEIVIQDPKEFTTSINGQIPISEEILPAKQEETT